MVQELASLVRAFGKNPKQEDLQKIVTQIDPSGDGNISFDQFMQVCRDVSVQRRLLDNVSFLACSLLHHLLTEIINTRSCQ